MQELAMTICLSQQKSEQRDRRTNGFQKMEGQLRQTTEDFKAKEWVCNIPEEDMTAESCSR